MDEREPTPFGTGYDPRHMRLMLWLAPFGFVNPFSPVEGIA